MVWSVPERFDFRAFVIFNTLVCDLYECHSIDMEMRVLSLSGRLSFAHSRNPELDFARVREHMCLFCNQIYHVFG